MWEKERGPEHAWLVALCVFFRLSVANSSVWNGSSSTRNMPYGLKYDRPRMVWEDWLEVRRLLLLGAHQRERRRLFFFLYLLNLYFLKMGKSQKKKAMRRHNPVRVPDSHLPKGLASASSTSTKNEAILPIIQKVCLIFDFLGQLLSVPAS